MSIARMGGRQGNCGAGERTWGWKAMAELFGAGRASRDSRAGRGWWGVGAVQTCWGVIQGWGHAKGHFHFPKCWCCCTQGAGESWDGGQVLAMVGGLAPLVPTLLGSLTPSLLPTVQPVLRPPARPGGPRQRLPRQTREGRGVLLPLGGLCPPWQGLQCQVGMGGSRGSLGGLLWGGRNPALGICRGSFHLSLSCRCEVLEGLGDCAGLDVPVLPPHSRGMGTRTCAGSLDCLPP